MRKARRCVGGFWPCRWAMELSSVRTMAWVAVGVGGCACCSSPLLGHIRTGREAARTFPGRRVSVVSKAAMGRFSGAIHGSNARSGFRRTGPGRDEEDDQHDATDTNLGQDTFNNSLTEGSDHDGFYDDVSDDEVSVHSQKTSNSRELSVDIDVYDDVHGDFWPNDPYFQEMEASQGKTAGQEQLFDENETTPARNSAQHMTMDHGRHRHAQRFQNENDGSNKNGAIIDIQAMTCYSVDASSTNATQSERSASLQMQKDQDVSENTFTIAMDDNIRVAESSSLGSLDASEKKQPVKSKSQKHITVQIDRGRKAFKVRETEDAERPVDIMGSLEADGLLEREGGQHFKNPQVNPTDLEDSKQSLGTVGEHNSARSTPLVKPSEVSDTSLSVVAVGQVEATQGQVVTEIGSRIVSEIGNESTEDLVQAEDIHTPIVEQVGQVVDQVAELIPDLIKERVVQIVDHIDKIPMQVSQAAGQVVPKVVDEVAEAVPDFVVLQASQVADQVSQAAEQIAEQVASCVVDPITTTASQIASILSADEDSDDSDDEFEAYRSLDVPEFKGIQGLNNFTILQEDQGLLVVIYNFYIYMLKKPLPEFVLGMFAAPILLSAIFTLLYLPEISGLALDETARQFLDTSGKNAAVGPRGLQLSSQTLFQVFMFSVSLSTGLQPELAPLSPYALVVANLNALIAQLIFVFLSGAVFARLTQPSQPVRCSTVALVCPPSSSRRLRKEACHKVLLTRFVLVGPQPCELVDVKVDLTYKYNTVTRSGSYFRMQQSLKLVRPEIAYLNHGMLVRHTVDETSPLYQRTQEMLEKEDGIFSLSVVGLERSSMQSVFHVQHYCVYDGDVIWNAEFEDMILLSKKNRRVVDHSLLSSWRPVNCRS